MRDTINHIAEIIEESWLVTFAAIAVVILCAVIIYKLFIWLLRRYDKTISGDHRGRTYNRLIASVTRFAFVVATFFIVLYLLGAHAFSGLIDILRARAARQFEAPSWKNSLAEGIASIGIAVVAVVFGLILGNMRSLTMIYAAGLIYSAFLNLLSVFRKTAIVYIP
jgi:hypothetical protein